MGSGSGKAAVLEVKRAVDCKYLTIGPLLYTKLRPLMLPSYAEQRRQIEVPHQTTQSQLFLYNPNTADEYLIGLLFKGDNEYKKQTQERHFPLHTAG